MSDKSPHLPHGDQEETHVDACSDEAVCRCLIGVLRSPRRQSGRAQVWRLSNAESEFQRRQRTSVSSARPMLRCLKRMPSTRSMIIPQMLTTKQHDEHFGPQNLNVATFCILPALQRPPPPRRTTSTAAWSLSVRQRSQRHARRQRTRTRPECAAATSGSTCRRNRQQWSVCVCVCVSVWGPRRESDV
jgi:hypothetical protein